MESTRQAINDDEYEQALCRHVGNLDRRQNRSMDGRNKVEYVEVGIYDAN